jgi:hypothetical protein
MEIQRSLVVLMEGHRNILRPSRIERKFTTGSFLIPFVSLSTSNSTIDFYGMGSNRVVK